MSTPRAELRHTPQLAQWVETYETTNQANPIDLALDTVEGEIRLADETHSPPDPAGSEGETIMSEDNRKKTITFTIDIPSGRIVELKQLLEGLEVRFDPQSQIIAFNDAMMSQSVAIGHHLPGMVAGMNRSLDEAGLTPRISEDHEGWSIERRQAFLQFAIENFNWDDDKINQEWWVDEGISWEEVTTRYPLVFGEQQA